MRSVTPPKESLLGSERSCRGRRCAWGGKLTSRGCNKFEATFLKIQKEKSSKKAAKCNQP